MHSHVTDYIHALFCHGKAQCQVLIFLGVKNLFAEARKQTFFTFSQPKGYLEMLRSGQVLLHLLGPLTCTPLFDRGGGTALGSRAASGSS